MKIKTIPSKINPTDEALNESGANLPTPKQSIKTKTTVWWIGKRV